MKIRFAGLSRRQVVRGAACAVLPGLVACVGGTTNADIFTPWGQPRGPNPAFARQVVTYPTHERPGTIIVDPYSHFLYVIHDAGQAIRYGVGVGAEGFVWSGRATVHSKQEWPDWYPPPEMLARKPELRQHMVQLQSGIGMKGGPDNPLGARAMYLWSGNKDTLYRIHGTNEPWTNWHQRLVWLHPPDERGHRRSLQPHADRRESHRVRERQRRIAKEVGLGGDRDQAG